MSALISERLDKAVRVTAFVAVLFGFSITEATATRVALDEREDPFVNDAKCIGYRYLSPPRIDKDQLTLGLTSDVWSIRNIWFCPESGYASYRFDFDLTNDERQRLSDYLGQIDGIDYHSFSNLDKLVWMESIYRVRGRGPEFWSSFYRALYHNLTEIRRSHAAGRVLEVFGENRIELRDDPLELFGLAGVFIRTDWSEEACVCFLEGENRLLELVRDGGVSGDSGVALFVVYAALRDKFAEEGLSCKGSQGAKDTDQNVDYIGVSCGDVMIH